MTTLPNEILEDIFNRSLASRQELLLLQASPTAFVSSIPICISHVCRRWRNVSLYYGELWSRLFLTYTYEGDGGLQRCIAVKQIIDACIERTNGGLLNFTCHISLDSTEPDDVHHTAKCVIDALLTEQYRWNDVSFVWTSVKIPRVKVDNMPMLTSLHLDLRMRVDWLEHRPHIDIGRSLQLKRLHLKGQFDLEVGNKPINALTEPSVLHFEGPPIPGWHTLARKACLDVIKIAPNLMQFRGLFHVPVQVGWPIELGEETSTQETHNLRELRLDGSCTPTVIDALHLPQLESVRYYDNQPLGSRKFLNFLRRSRPPLTYLDLGTSPEGTLIATLQLLPQLQELRTIFSPVSEIFFRALMVSHDVPQDLIICPALISLRIRLLSYTGRTTCINALLAMLESRRQFLGTFTRVWLHEESNIISMPFRTGDRDKIAHNFSEGQSLCAEREGGDRNPFNVAIAGQ